MPARRGYLCLAVPLLVLACDAGTPGASGSAMDSLALTPPMGWNSWNRFHCDINEDLVRQIAEAMVSSGMRDAGYRYVNIDDCWHGTRDSAGYIQPDPRRFPGGMRALADHVHSLGLRIGIYSDAGAQTCARFDGSRGHEAQDAEQYARWGFDYLKYDWCDTGGLDPREAYGLMREALERTGRPVVFSICEWGTNEPWLWASGVGHLWRTTGDIGMCWDRPQCREPWENGVVNILDLQIGLERYAGPGHWNDPDMLEVGNGMSATEDRAHFSMWAILAAPLIAGNDLRTMSDTTREILTNREVIAVDQDSLGVQGRKVRDDGDEEVWLKPLSGGAYAVALLNRGPAAARIQVGWQELGLPAGSTAEVRDLWEHRDLGSFERDFSARVRSHGVVLVRVVPASAAARR